MDGARAQPADSCDQPKTSNTATTRGEPLLQTRRAIRTAVRAGFRLLAVMFGGAACLVLLAILDWNLIGVVSGLLLMAACWLGRLMVRLLGELLAANLASLQTQRRWRRRLSSLESKVHRLDGAVRSYKAALDRLQRSNVGNPRPRKGRQRKSGSKSDPHVDAVTSGRIALLDLASLGLGQPEGLAAARLDQSVFPRLAKQLDDDLPADGGPSELVKVSEGVTTRNVFREWQQAIENRDLPACRVIHATLSQALDAALLEPMSAQLLALEADVEDHWRSEFAAAVRARDYARALDAGDEILKLFPERRIAEDFRALRSLLTRRVV
ncbi:MAG: hypothetical protein ACPGXK_00490 [Phycisphaerae bacterium]